MKCPKCNSDVKKGALFCTQCGVRLFDDANVSLGTFVKMGTNIDAGPANILNEDNTSVGKEIIKTPVEEQIKANNITQSINAWNRKLKVGKKSKVLFISVGIIASLIVLIGVLLTYLNDNPSKNAPIKCNIRKSSLHKIQKDTLQNIQTTKYFVKRNDDNSNIYYSVELNLLWPNYLGEGDVEPLQRAIANKAFGLIGDNIDETIPAFFQSYGKEISELPPISETTYDQRYITINISKVSEVEGEYIAFSIYYMETAYGGSIHAADIWEKYVNYDIRNSKVLSLSDILIYNSEKEVLDELKRSLSIDWDYVGTPNVLPEEALLTEKGLCFIFEGFDGLERVEINLSNEYISSYVKQLFQIKEEYNEAKTEGIKFLENIYKEYIFGNQDFSSIASDICSKRILQRLKDESCNDCENGDCYALWLFRRNAQNESKGNSIVNNIIAKDNNWFDVYYSDMGLEGKTSFRLIEHDDKIIIDEIFVDKSYINYNQQKHPSVNFDNRPQQNVKKSMIFFDEPAYLMTNGEVEAELVGAYYWQCTNENSLYINPNHNTLGFTISMNGLEMLNEFVKTIYPMPPTSNINGTVPANAKYEEGHWYKQNNTQNNATMYFLVGHEVNIEIMNFANSEWIGNEIIHNEANPNAYIIVMRDKNENWYYVSKSGQYMFNKQ